MEAAKRTATRTPRQQPGLKRRRRREEIVDDIMRELGDPTDLVLSGEETRKSLLHKVEGVTQILPLSKKIMGRDQTAEVEYAKKLDALISALARMLENPPGLLATWLFGPLRLGNSFEDMIAVCESDKRAFLDKLRYMRDVARGRRSRRGPSPDIEKDECAASAYSLMKALTRKPITGTTGAEFETIAALLYEAGGLCLYDEEEEAPSVNMKRACDRTRRLLRIFRLSTGK
jgi:hypothetical protein